MLKKHSTMTKWLFLALLSVSSLQIIYAQNGMTEENKQRLRNFVSASMSCNQNIGASVTLVKNNQVVFAEGFGYRNMEDALPMENNTRINIGSISKGFTTTLVAEVLSQGLATLDTPLKDIIGQNFTLEGDYRTQQASLRDILSHRLGIPSYWGVSTAALNVSRAEIVG